MINFDQWLENRLQSVAKRANLDISKFDSKQLKMGYKAELEHGKGHKDTNVTNSDPVKTLKIAVAHLRENPKYYSALKKVEK